MTTARIPQSQSAAYRAAALIYTSGPMSRTELFAKIHFSERTANSAQILNAAIVSGWLEDHPEGITLSDKSRDHFSGQAAEIKPKYIGQIAAPRTGSAYDRPPLSKRFIPNSKGFRDDVPEYSVREQMSFRTVAGGSV